MKPQFLIIGLISILAAITLIIMRFRKQAPGRLFQVWLGWIALAYVSTLQYPTNLIGFGLLIIVPFLSYSRISFPVYLNFERDDLNELKDYPKWNEFSLLILKNGFQHVQTRKWLIMPGAEMLILLFGNRYGVIIELQRQSFMKKNVYSMELKTFFKDGSSFTTTNHISNQDLAFKAKHPQCQVRCPSLEGLLAIHTANIQNYSRGKSIETDEKRIISEMLLKEYGDKIENMVSLGYWKIEGDRCRITTKGKLRLLVSYYNFLPLFAKTRIV
jgi:hypothetical protein